MTRFRKRFETVAITRDMTMEIESNRPTRVEHVAIRVWDNTFDRKVEKLLGWERVEKAVKAVKAVNRHGKVKTSKMG